MRRIPILLALVCAAGCARNPAPAGWLLAPREAAGDPFGGWIVIDRIAGLPRVTGELLAIGSDSTYVLSADAHVQAVALTEVSRLRLAWYDGQTSLVITWSVFGTLGTASNGLLAAFTFPLWIIVGTAASATQSHAPLISGDSLDWLRLVPYARFPQGLPPDLPRTLPTKR